MISVAFGTTGDIHFSELVAESVFLFEKCFSATCGRFLYAIGTVCTFLRLVRFTLDLFLRRRVLSLKLRLHKDIVDGPHGSLKVPVLHADDNVQL